jgi:sugar lactone lactonase YvrE
VALHGGRLFVCDTVLNNVISYDFRSGDVRLLSTNLGADRLRNPINIEIADDGTKYIADIERGQVVVFGPDDSYQTSLGLPGSAQPCDVAIDGDRLFVADLQDDEIEIWDRHTGQAVGAFGGPGSEPGQFHGPTNISLAPDGTLWVTDTNGFRIQHLTAEGEPLLVLGRVGMSHGEFARPKGIAVDPAGRPHVVDAAFNNVQIFNDRGDLLMFYGGSGPDRSHLDLPADVEIVTDPGAITLFADRVMPGEEVAYLLLVSSQFGEPRVNVYGFLDTGDDVLGDAAVSP